MITHDNTRQYFWDSWSSVMSPWTDHTCSSPTPKFIDCPLSLLVALTFCHSYRHTYRMEKYLFPIHKRRTAWDVCPNIWTSLAKLLWLIHAFPHSIWSFCRRYFSILKTFFLQRGPLHPKPFQIIIIIDHNSPARVLLGSNLGSPLWKRRQCSPTSIYTRVLTTAEGWACWAMLLGSQRVCSLCPAGCPYSLPFSLNASFRDDPSTTILLEKAPS